ncbi:hypothetical protein BGX29_007142 [Mortierella sp. GBA35]|nr:hypothetical protein BGX29_007142 [Mortierella sp. GBA35]
MSSTKNSRSLLFIVIVAVSMLLASTSVEAIPPPALAAMPNPLACVDCPNPPVCDYRYCEFGYYCYVDRCACLMHCKEGQEP